jgi:hypothetical protein
MPIMLRSKEQPMKKISLANRKEYIETLRKEIEKQLAAINLIESYTPSTFEQRVIHLYAIEGSVKDVADKLNAQDERINGRKFISNDISAIIRQKPMDELHEITKKAFEHNSKGFRFD